jgi:hypothetical protein
MAIEDKLPPTRNQQHFKHRDDSTEPKFLFKMCIQLCTHVHTAKIV